MTEVDQVTQSNSAQTEELSATAESLSEQAAHLLELVGAFTLSHAGNGQRERKVSQPQVGTAQHLNKLMRQPAKAIRSGLAAQTSLIARGSRKRISKQPTLATAVPIGATINDASFQEF